MKRAWHLVALVSVLSLTAWIGIPGVARALPSCSLYEGKSCAAGSDSVMCNGTIANEVCDCDLIQGHYVWICTT